MTTWQGDILSPEGWLRGQIHFDAEIAQIEGTPIDAPKAPYILPGFVDLHVHGGFGRDMMDGQAAIETAARFHANHGTTSLLATSVTAPLLDIEAFLVAANSVALEAPLGRARVLGVHLEGPFLNENKLGAQPPHSLPATLGLVEQWEKLAPIKVMTIAPEVDNVGHVAAYLQSKGVKVQIGHSLCDYATAAAALQSGQGITHLFNAMTGLAHRDNGIAGAALAHADFAEIIPDLQHVEAGAILAARRAIPNLYGVTDAMSGAGMPDGEFRLGTLTAIKTGDTVRLASGNLAGSVLTMDQALRNLVAIGLPLAEASRRLSTIPANWINEPSIGRIAKGAKADLLRFDDLLSLEAVVVEGGAVSV